MQRERLVGPVRAEVFHDLRGLESAWERRATAPSGDRRKAAAPRVVHEPTSSVRELCHDLRQPLAVAGALALTLAEQEGLDAAGRARVHQLLQQLQQLSELVAAPLAPPGRAPVDLATLAGQVCASEDVVSGALVERALDGPVVVDGDAVQLRRLLVNLLINARRAAGADGRVRVAVTSQPGYAALEVHDSGTGGATGEGSTGLGLLIVSGIVERHGGRTESGPSELGGLCIRVLLPLGAAERAS